jgi:hypothetical protein
MDMSGMSSTFSSSIRVTLWFTTWTTTTPATYFLTVLFLFFLGMLNRFLGALKSQLDRKWQKQHSSAATFAGSTEKPPSAGFRGHTRQWSRALRPQPVRLEEPDGQETQPLSPAVQAQQTDDETDAEPATKRRTFWVANAPWSIKKDGISAALEFVRALIGYILYSLWCDVHEWTARLTILQHARGHVLQRWIFVRRNWERVARRDGIWKIYKRFCKLG